MKVSGSLWVRRLSHDSLIGLKKGISEDFPLKAFEEAEYPWDYGERSRPFKRMETKRRRK